MVFGCFCFEFTISTAQAITDNTSLTHLDLSQCDIGANGVTVLALSLNNKSHMQYLDLRENKFGSMEADCLFLGRTKDYRRFLYAIYCPYLHQVLYLYNVPEMNKNGRSFSSIFPPYN